MGLSKEDTQGMGQEPSNRQHHHHHTHHRHGEKHIDESERFKRSSLSAQKKRKIISNVLFVVLTILAIGIVAACVLINYM